MDFDAAMSFFREAEAAAALTGCNLDSMSAGYQRYSVSLRDARSERYRAINVSVLDGVMVAEVWRNGAYDEPMHVNSIRTAIGVMRSEAPDVCQMTRQTCSTSQRHSEARPYVGAGAVVEVQP